MELKITRTSGETELFDIKKFRLSLEKVGASPTMINDIIAEMKRQRPNTTKKIHAIASALLQDQEPAIAARYNLKRALMDLGPAGFPFEQFIAQLFAQQGYSAKTNQTVSGFCVDHEVDVIVEKSNEHAMVECKFHNRLGLKTDVKVALYIQARFEDIKKAWEQKPEHPQKFHRAWIITNTRFTSEAVKYASCMNIKLLGWSYPQNNNLATMIDKLGLHPITALTSLTKKQKRDFIKRGFVLCRDARKHIGLLKSFGFTPHQIEKLVSESEATCNL